MHRFSNAAKKIILPGLLLSLIATEVQAREGSLFTTVQDSVSKTRKAGLEISGVVKDIVTGKPIDGIRVSVSDYSSTFTNDKGEFKLSVPHYNVFVSVSGSDYQSKEIALKGEKKLTVQLYSDSFNGIYDEVTLPNSTTTALQVPGAVSSVNVNDGLRRAGESADTYLQGRVTGLNAIRRSGTPGVGASLFLRGFNSLYTTNQPLILVDGILYDNNNYGISLLSGHIDNPIANIDLKDIDNVTVIKDATASAYGTKAANGVILITTARAKEQATKIDFTAYGGLNFAPSTLPVLNADQYRTYLSEAMYSYYTGQGFSELNAQKTINALPFMNSSSSTYYKYNANTDWQKEVLNSSSNQSYYLKVTGGDNIATYGLSVGYLNNQGITRNTNLQRYQTRFNADLNLSKKLKGNANLAFVSNLYDLRDQGLSEKTNPIFLALTKAPFLAVNEIGADGAMSPNVDVADNLNGSKRSNPVALIDGMEGSNKNYRFTGSVGFDYNFNKHLDFKFLTGVTFSKVRENYFVPERGVVPDTLLQDEARNQAGTNVERLFSVYTDARLSYVKNFNYRHNLSTNIGVRFNDNDFEADFGRGYNNTTDDYVLVGSGPAGLRKVGGENGAWRWLNLYAGADYNYLQKYFLSFNLGVDGSSRFGKDAVQGITLFNNPFAVMPSVAAAWLVTSEDFIRRNDFLNVLKLRASYGLVGNDDIGNYAAKQYYISQGLFTTQGLVRGNLPNTALQWETVAKLNAGLDASLLKERLNISFDVFNNNTSKMMVLEPVKTVTGFSEGFTNNGKMQTRGVELGLSGRLVNRALKWDAGFNISHYKTKLTGLPSSEFVSSYSGAQILSRLGQEANLFYGYRTEGVYATTAEANKVINRNADGSETRFQGGDVIFRNSNTDNDIIERDGSGNIISVTAVIDENDREVIGNPNPDFVGAFSNVLSWKRFSVDALFTFSVGNDVYNAVRRNLESMNGYQNQTLHVLNRWRYEGQETNTPRAAFNDLNANSRFSDRWIEDGSYLRLRTLSIGYDIPVKGTALKSAKIYLTGNNLFTISKYLGYDPEFSATGSVFSQGVDTSLEPQFRSMQLGIRVGL